MSSYTLLLDAAVSLDAARATVLSLISTIEGLERAVLADLLRAGEPLATAGRGSIARSARGFVVDASHPVSSLAAAVETAYGDRA